MDPTHTPSSLVAAGDLQLAVCIQAWEHAAASGHWSEPAPVEVDLLAAGLAPELAAEPEPEPSLVGSAWDSWSWGDHWLDDPQVEELPGCWDT
jgi:hypothetical protein